VPRGLRVSKIKLSKPSFCVSEGTEIATTAQRIGGGAGARAFDVRRRHLRSCPVGLAEAARASPQGAPYCSGPFLRREPGRAPAPPLRTPARARGWTAAAWRGCPAGVLSKRCLVRISVAARRASSGHALHVCATGTIASCGLHKNRGGTFLFVLGGASTTGQPSSAARPPKKHGPASRRPRPSAGSAPLSLPLYCLSTRPTSPPYPSPQLLYPPSPPRRRQTQCWPVASGQQWRVTSNWPPSSCPLHGATRPLPTGLLSAAKTGHTFSWGSLLFAPTPRHELQ
jgi:hypothetical protein